MSERVVQLLTGAACIALAGMFFAIGRMSTAPEPTWSRLCVRAHAEMWAQPQAMSIGKDQIAGAQVLLVQVCDAYAFKCVTADNGSGARSCGAMPLVNIVPAAPSLQPQTPSRLPRLRGSDTAL